MFSQQPYKSEGKQQGSTGITIIPLLQYKHTLSTKRYAETKAYTVRNKLELVTRMWNGEAQCKISREMGITESTLQGWLKDEVKLREFVHTLQDDDS